MEETEIRCGGCVRQPGYLLATVRNDVVFAVDRIGSRKAHAVGVNRTGVTWRKAAMDGPVALLRCRRCGKLTRYDTRSTTAATARSVARPSVAQ